MNSFIPYIYCYCDHFCERCPFTGRCAVFAGSSALAGEDPNRPEFWQKVLDQFAESHGYPTGPENWEFELRQPTAGELEQAQCEQDAAESRLAADPLIGRAAGWEAAVFALLEDVSFWRRKARDAASEAAMGLRSPKAAMREAQQVTDYLHWLRRYTEIAHVRLREAVGNGRPGNAEHISTDGLAKSALHCIAGARAALADLYEVFPDEDRILPLFSLLGALERAAEERYPRAHNFIRPGFDEYMQSITA